MDEEEKGLRSGVVVKKRGKGKLRILDIEGKLPRDKD